MTRADEDHGGSLPHTSRQRIEPPLTRHSECGSGLPGLSILAHPPDQPFCLGRTTPRASQQVHDDLVPVPSARLEP